MSDLPPDLPKIELPENEMYSFFNKHSAELIELLQEAVKVLRNDVRIELVDDGGPCIRIGDTVDITPVIMTRKSIAGVREVPGYQLITYKYYPGSRFDPPDVDEVELGSPNQSQTQIVIEAIKWYVSIVLEQSMENICIERSLREE